MKAEAIKKYISRFQFGYLSYSSFLICILSGIAIAFVYDSNNPDYSISLMLLINKPAMFIRAIHYWSAQIFLITTVIHIIEHLLRKSELNVKTKSWAGMIVIIPFLFYALISGFILKGDQDSRQAFNILKSVTDSIPIIGNILSDIFLGNSSSLQIIYIHHIVSSTLIIWLLAIEHSKIIIPNVRNILQILPIIAFFSLFFIPTISYQSNLVLKGPWYFAGIQEIFYWLSNPSLVIYFFIIYSIVFFLIKFVNEKKSNIIKILSLSLLLFYLVISIFALFFRGESWQFVYPWNEQTNFANFIAIKNLKSPDDSLLKKQVPLIRGKVESCMYCHSGMTGFSESHKVEILGCYSCHLGEPLSTDKNIAHSGMTLTPGNLDIVDKTCGTVDCHSGISQRVRNSLMNTMSGVVAVNKFVFDESPNPDGHYDISKIKFSESDKHLRGLCAGCHLSTNKEYPAKIDELTRGGGCSACHLNYKDSSLIELNNLKSPNRTNPKHHPEINIQINNNSCFGCHSRSGRISTNYEGWHETHYKENDYQKLDKRKYRLLQDGRVFEIKPDDVHHKAGMECIDCHNSYEIMGDGNRYQHKEDAVKIKCDDCHSKSINTISFDKMDLESQRIINLTNKIDKSSKFVVSKATNIPFVNTIMIENKVITYPKKGNKMLLAKPESEFCGKNIQGHKRLDCKTCHTSWAPQCVGCHTKYDANQIGFDNLTNKETKGAWIEKERDYISEFPTLGVVKSNSGDKISTFVPGMVLSIEKSNKTNLFKRLFAPAFSHTIQRNASTCKTCHNNPVALGYGRGDLNYNTSTLKWSFKPKYELNKNDKLPEDAWIPFLQNGTSNSTTRTNTRPFSVDEQKRILFVGTCFTCHKENEKKVLNSLNDIRNIKSRLSKLCLIPKD